MSKSFAQEVHEKFADLQVKIEKKGRFNYSAWTDMLTLLLQHYPESDYKVWYEPFDDGTVMVYCDLAIRDGEKLWKRFMYLPVMDNNNLSIKNPTTRDISDSYMRCFVKALATTGLGLYVYRGEELPNPDNVSSSDRVVTEEEAIVFMDKLEKIYLDDAPRQLDKIFETEEIKTIQDLKHSAYEQLMGILIDVEETRKNKESV